MYTQTSSFCQVYTQTSSLYTKRKKYIYSADEDFTWKRFEKKNLQAKDRGEENEAFPVKFSRWFYRWGHKFYNAKQKWSKEWTVWVL